MAINWTVIIMVLGIAGIFSQVVLKIFSSKIQKQLNGHELKIDIHGEKIAELEDDSDRYRTATVRLSAAIKDLEKVETKIDELSKSIERDFREILKMLSNKGITSKKV